MLRLKRDYQNPIAAGIWIAAVRKLGVDMIEWVRKRVNLECAIRDDRHGDLDLKLRARIPTQQNVSLQFSRRVDQIPKLLRVSRKGLLEFPFDRHIVRVNVELEGASVPGVRFHKTADTPELGRPVPRMQLVKAPNTF